MTIITVTINIKPISHDRSYHKKDGDIVNYTHTEAKIGPSIISIDITECECTSAGKCRIDKDVVNPDANIIEEIRSEIYSSGFAIDNIRYYISQSVIGKIQGILDDGSYDVSDKKEQIRELLDGIEAPKIKHLTAPFNKTDVNTYEAKLHINDIFLWQPLYITISRQYMDDPRWGNTINIDTPVELTMHYPDDRNDLFQWHNGYISYTKDLYYQKYNYERRFDY